MAHTLLKEGDMAPSFEMQKDPNEDGVYLRDFKGKYLLIDFWASWCIPCRKKHPELIRLYEKYKSVNFEILGISLDKSKESWLKAINSDKLTWKQASDLKFWNNECVKLYGIYFLPFNVLIDKDGIIVSINLSDRELDQWLEKEFRKM